VEIQGTKPIRLRVKWACCVDRGQDQMDLLATQVKFLLTWKRIKKHHQSKSKTQMKMQII